MMNNARPDLRTEPQRVWPRPFCLSYAATAASSNVVPLFSFGWRCIRDGLQKSSVVEPVGHSMVANSTVSKLFHGPRD